MGGPNLRADPAALANLRRAGNVVDAAGQPRTIELYRSLAKKLGWRDFNEGRLAAVAATAHVLAHVREDTKGKLSTAHLLGGKDPVLFRAAIPAPYVGTRPRRPSCASFARP